MCRWPTKDSAAPPYKLVDNENSLIDTTDLVFVDAIDTGFSRVVSGANNAQFHGVRGDLRAFGEFINNYLKTYSRWPSPKYLIGESYGTIRSAGLAQELQNRHGIELNGIVLVSSLLTYETLSPSPQNDVRTPAHVETYTATAWYHKKLPAELAGDLKKAVDESRTFAFGEYLTALAKGNRATAAERKATAQKLARSPVSHPSTSSGRTCASIPAAFAKSCCATSASSSVVSTAGSPPLSATPPVRTTNSTSRTPRCRVPTPRSSRTT